MIFTISVISGDFHDFYNLRDFKSMISGDFHDFYNLCDFKSGDF